MSNSEIHQDTMLCLQAVWAWRLSVYIVTKSTSPVLQFQCRNADKCTQVLKQHEMNNIVNSKRTFVRTLMNMDIIPNDDDLDTYLQDDIIVNAIMDNDVNDNDIQSHSE